MRRGIDITPGILWAHGWRAVTVVLPLLAMSAIIVLSGAAGQPVSWLTVPSGLGAAAAGLAWLVWWRRPGRRVAAVLLAVAAVSWGVTVWVWSPPGTGMLVAALEEVQVPASARLVEQSSGGNVLCFDVCTAVRRRYVVPDASPDEVTRHLRRALQDAGHRLAEPVAPRSVSTTLDGDLHLTGRVEPHAGGQGAVLQLRAIASG